MADLTITPGGVLAGANAQIRNGIAGATITAGQALYKDTNANVMKLADANGSAAERVLAGIALHASLTGQPIAYIIKDDDFTPGATLVAGTSYMLSSAAPGGIAPVADATAGDYVTDVGVAKSVTKLNVNFTASGAVKA